MYNLVHVRMWDNGIRLGLNWYFTCVCTQFCIDMKTIIFVYSGLCCEVRVEAGNVSTCTCIYM